MNKFNDFVSVTHASEDDARLYLERANGDLHLAVSMYLTEQPDSAASSAAVSAMPSNTNSRSQSRSNSRSNSGIFPRTNSRTLSTSSSRSSLHRASRSRIATLSDIGADASSLRPLSQSNDDRQQLFTGGEKSGLAVTPQDHGNSSGGRAAAEPTSLVDQIIKRAQRSMASNHQSSDSDVPEPPVPQPPSFLGRGFRLGSEDNVDSAIVDDDNDYESGSGSDSGQLPLLQRTLNFWSDGFSIDDGPLYRFDDPANDVYLRAINMGRAPIALLNVKPKQAVDVKIVQHPTDFVKPSPSLDNSGPGQRLGTGVVTTSLESPLPNSPAENFAVSTRAGSALGVEGDAAVQIRFADGTVRRARFERRGPVQQLYDYVSSVSESGRQYVLQTPLPSNSLDDRQQSLESAGAVGAVVVQRWI